MRRVIVAAMLAAMSYAPAAVASDDAVNSRRGYFQLVKLNFGPLGGMAKGSVPYDATQAATLAANLDALTSMDVMNQYPPGSGKIFMPGKTRATGAIWNDTAGFAAKYADLQAAVDGLVAAAGQGRGALAQAVGQAAGACKGCHQGYRAKDF